MPTLDYLGRTVIPKHIRTALNLEPEDELDIKIEGHKIIIEPINLKCCACGITTTNKINNIPICNNCLTKLRNGRITKTMG